MPYELFVSWRYLRSGKPSFVLLLVLAVSVVGLALGLSLFVWSPFRFSGALLMILSTQAIVLALLLTLFSAFTAIAIFALAIGVASFTWVLSVTTGFQEAFQEKVLGVNAHVLVLKWGVDFSEYREVMRKVQAVPGVTAAAPFLFNEMMIARGTRLSGVLVKGVDPNLVGKVLALPKHIVAPKNWKGQMGPLLSSALDKKQRARGRPGLILGQRLADKLKVHVGDAVRLVSPLSNMDGSGMSADVDLPRSRDFRVSAIFDSGFAEYDQRLVYVHMREAQEFFDQGDVVTGVELKLVDFYQARRLAKKILSALGGSPYRTVDWSELNRNLFRALSNQKVFLEIILGFLLALVACFNVVAALTMLVLRKHREIAVLKALGSSAAGIARVFQCCGLIVWVFGASIGLSGGYLGGLLLRNYGFALNPKVYLIGELPVRMDPLEFLVTAAVALVICLLSTLYPAVRAARLVPVVGLHGTRE